MHGAHEIPRVPPIPLGFQIAKQQLGRHAEFDASNAVGNFAGDELRTPPGTLVVEENAVGAGDVIGFAVIQREIKTGYLTDAIGASRVKGRSLALRRIMHLPEHLARSGEIETTL